MKWFIVGIVVSWEVDLIVLVLATLPELLCSCRLHRHSITAQEQLTPVVTSRPSVLLWPFSCTPVTGAQWPDFAPDCCADRHDGGHVRGCSTCHLPGCWAGRQAPEPNRVSARQNPKLLIAHFLLATAARGMMRSLTPPSHVNYSWHNCS